MMLRIAAQFFSFILHPLLMPTVLFATLWYFFPAAIQPAKATGFILLLIFVMTFILPVLNMVFFKVTGTITNLNLANRRDRILPFIFVTLVYAAVTAMFYWKMYIPVVFKLMLMVTALSLLVLVATLFFKISVHAVGSSGLAGILLAMATLASATELLWPALVMIVLAGFAMSSRLQLNAHTLAEVSWGGVLGFASAFGGMLILF